MPFGYGLWKWFAANPAAQAIAAVLAFLALWKANNVLVGRSASRRQREKAERAAIKTQAKIEDASNAKSEQVEIARRDAPSVAHSDELPSDTQSRIFGDS